MHQIPLYNSVVVCSEVAVLALRPVLLPDSLDVLLVCLGWVSLSVANVGHDALRVKLVPAWILLRRFHCIHPVRNCEESHQHLAAARATRAIMLRGPLLAAAGERLSRVGGVGRAGGRVGPSVALCGTILHCGTYTNLHCMANYAALQCTMHGTTQH